MKGFKFGAILLTLCLALASCSSHASPPGPNGQHQTSLIAPACDQVDFQILGQEAFRAPSLDADYLIVQTAAFVTNHTGPEAVRLNSWQENPTASTCIDAIPDLQLSCWLYPRLSISGPAEKSTSICIPGRTAYSPPGWQRYLNSQAAYYIPPIYLT